MIKSENIICNICENCEDAEKLLLEAVESDDTDVAYEAKLALIQLYGTGHLVILEHGEYMKMKEEMRLYKSAVDSIKRYKDSGEELMDFDDFMGEMEKEYENKTNKGSTE
jgi:hypothetical protein